MNKKDNTEDKIVIDNSQVGVWGDHSIISDGISFLTPENVTMIISMITAAIGVTTTAIKGIKLWVDERKSRKIKIKCKDIELEITGAVSEDEIFRKLSIFNDLKDKIEKKDIQILLSK